MKVPGPHVHYLSLGQAAALAGLDRETIRDLVKKGALRSVKLPMQEWARIPRMDVVALRRNLDAQLEGA